MTLRPFGRVTPVQGLMLQLAGYVIAGSSMRLGSSVEERKAMMIEGHRGLCEITGRDLGYDLGAWHNHLCGDRDSGYTHAYAYAAFLRAIEEALVEPERRRIADQLRGEPA